MYDKPVDSLDTPAPLTMSASHVRLMLAVATVSGHAFKHLMNAAFFVLLPELKVGLGLTYAGVGTISAVRSISGGLINIPAGFVADRFQSQGATILGVIIILVGLFTSALGFVNSFFAALIIATLGGMAITFWHPTAISALSRRFPERRGFAIALHGTGGSIGEALGPLIVGVLILVMGWRLVFHSIGAVGIFGGIAVWLLLRRSWRDRTDTIATVGAYLESLRALLVNHHILMLLLMVMCYGAVQSTVFTFLPSYIRLDVGYSASVMSMYIAAGQVAGIFSQPAMGYLSDRYGRKQVLLPGLILLSIVLPGIALVPPGVPLFLVVVVMGMFLFPLLAIFLAAATDVAGENVQGTAVSLVFGVSVIVAGISPYVGGLLADAFGVKVVFLYSSGLSAFTAVLLALQRWPRVPSISGG